LPIFANVGEKIAIVFSKTNVKIHFCKNYRRFEPKNAIFGGKLHLNQHLVGTQCRTA
jgi:hypothetical protein